MFDVMLDFEESNFESMCFFVVVEMVSIDVNFFKFEDDLCGGWWFNIEVYF